MEKTFTQTDIDFIKKRGNSLEKIEQQLHFFSTGIPKINLVKSATVGDGIWKFSEEEIQSLVNYFDKHKYNYSLGKFVPASGAATRMFQFLIEFINEFDLETETINTYLNKKNAKDLSIFVFGLKNFPFYETLKSKTIALNPDFYSFTNDKKQFLLIQTLIHSEGLNFSQKPKGILPFHTKEKHIATPIEENLVEADFMANPNIKTKIHFTINKEFQSDFEKITHQFPDFEVRFSYQDQTSDTLAVNLDNSLFRLESGEIFFRPGGHGALIENLNTLQSDLIFIKNIDNVAQNHKEIIATYKKVLGAILMETQQQVFAFLNKLERKTVSDSDLDTIIAFAEKQLSFPLSEDFEHYKNDYKVAYLKNVLNRPIRVCGMVKNEGEPGGGPFWVQDDKGRLTLQIVESSQIDFLNKRQRKIANSATHFNPVDIVCGVYDYKGDKFNLNEFVDHNAAFITEKTKNGKHIKAFELPGLWNGAMAKWTTIFVEVPLETFNPVKTVNDLLKPAHQQDNE